MGKGGTVTLSTDASTTAEGHIPATVPLLYSLDETGDIGRAPRHP